MKEKILFVSHPEKNCGVHEFGKVIATILRSSDIFDFTYAECGSLDDLNNAIQLHSPIVILYNYHPSTLPWITKKIIHKKFKSLNKHIQVPQVGIMHEVTQQKADEANNELFDYHIAPDPTLLLKNPIVFKTGRRIPRYNNNFSLPTTPTIGSFGFATPNKGFEEIVSAVQNEFDNAIIRFNIPSADFGDKDGSNAHKLVSECRKLLNKPGISLIATHDFLDQDRILDFLAQNTLNIFLYQDKNNRGISSTPDYALAVDRPLTVSDSIMFRHLHKLTPTIIYGRSSLKQIIQNGTLHLKKLANEWNDSSLLWEYERIVKAILKREDQNHNSNRRILGFQDLVRKLLGKEKRKFTWLRNTVAATEDSLDIDFKQSYTLINLPTEFVFNKILDDSARKLYKPTIEKLTELAPITMSKKIPEANVQQGFVFDTVVRMSKEYKSPKMLCVGSYEDTAGMALKKLGYKIDEVDPVLNYYLQEFYTKPNTVLGSYDIIFSTSVIEHDPDDKSFMKCIEGLLSEGGKAVLTCDYKDGWKPGDPKPDVDARFYTMHDLQTRLLSYIPNCKLVDKPQWECENPDFLYLNKYRYTFATFVIEKQKAIS